MDTQTLLIIIVIVLLLGGGGWYGRGRWFQSLDRRPHSATQ
jgi:LPXTG-motif cell wall-anchored protein